MWICTRCHQENKDSFAACENCGAARPGGRFGSAPIRAEHTARAPRVTAPAPAGQTPPPPVASARGAYQPPETQLPPRPRRAPARALARLVGMALCALLPLLTGLFAWRQYAALSGALLPLLLDADAAEIAKLLCYIGLSLIAGLLSLLPGLWTLLLSQRPGKRREDRP